MIEKLPVITLLLILSIIDIKKREVPHWGVLVLFLYSFFTVDKLSSSIFWAIITFLCLWIIYAITNGGIGGGDVKMLTALAFYFGSVFPVYLAFLCIISGIGFIAGFIYSRNLKISLPLIPFIFIAFLMFSIIPNILIPIIRY